MDGPDWIVLGLGNPGAKYAATRHNIGFRALDTFRTLIDAGRESDEGGYRLSWGEVGHNRLALIKPMTYMNRSGTALARFPGAVGIPPERHLLVYDDVSLPFGTTRFRRQGSDGGHNGVSSVLRQLRSVFVPRMRLGIGVEDRDPEQDLSEFVLQPFTESEERELKPWMEQAAIGLKLFFEEGPGEAMNRFNG